MPEQCANGRSGTVGIPQGRGRSFIWARRPQPGRAARGDLAVMHRHDVASELTRP